MFNSSAHFVQQNVFFLLFSLLFREGDGKINLSEGF